ncbi:MAG: lycopene cyclase domain-containing protein, partial [bacterium]
MLLVFEQKIKFYKKFIPVLVSILITGFILLAWDMIAVSRGDWFFNSNYVTGFKIMNLPFEEILFFVTVPFSILFIYECMKYYFENKNYIISRKIVLITAVIFLFSSVICLYY